ncbi:MAG: HEAT repeat domain-containing protein [Myxococcaceae bacterium]|nr:HEAT repeat domain-containing protein [Myxococcaceae bacterium]
MTERVTRAGLTSPGRGALARALWLAGALSALLPAAAPGRDRLSETGAVLASFERGELSVNQAANRISLNGGEQAATEYLTRKLAQLFDARRQTALLELLALVATPNATLSELAASALQGSDDLTQRLAAVRVLGRMKNPTLARVLTPLLSEKAVGLRREASRALVALKASKAAPALAKVAVLEEDPETRALMLVSVGRLGDPKQARALESLLDVSSESTRLAATQALCLLGHKKGLDAARALLASKDRSERLLGVMVLEGAAVGAVKAALEPMTTDPEAAVRARAARVLAQAGEQRWLEWLVVEGGRGTVDEKLVVETELEHLRLSDEQRAAILRRASLK